MEALTAPVRPLKLIPPITRSAATLSRREAQLIAGRFFQVKRLRRNFQRDVTVQRGKGQEHVALDFCLTQWSSYEKQLQRLLASYAGAHPAEPWLRAHLVTPHIAGAMIAYGNSDKTLEWFYRSFGLIRAIPMVGVLSRSLRTFRKYHIMKKVEPYYSLYRTRKDYEIAKVAQGTTTDRAMNLASYLKSPETSTYMDHAMGLCVRGQKSRRGWECGYFKYLPLEIKTLPGHVPLVATDSRARHWMVKIFVSHFYEVMNFIEKGIRPMPSRCKSIESYVPCPQTDLIQGMSQQIVQRL